MSFEKVVCFIGASRIGLVLASVLAHKCKSICVLIVDKNVQKIKRCNLFKFPIYEPGLKKLIQESKGRNLFFSTDINKAVYVSSIIFINVGTTLLKQGLGQNRVYDLKPWESAARYIVKSSNEPKIIVENSYAATQIAHAIKRVLDIHSKYKFTVLSNPFFFSYGNAVSEVMRPERVLIGGDSDDQQAMNELSSFYKGWVEESRIIQSGLWSAELNVLYSSALLAQNMCALNSVTPLCELTHTNIEHLHSIEDVRPCFGIGTQLQQNVQTLIYLLEKFSLKESAEYWKQLLTVNDYQKKRFFKKIMEELSYNISHKKIALIGIELDLLEELLKENANVSIYESYTSKEEVDDILSSLIEQTHSESLVSVENDLKSVLTGSSVLILVNKHSKFMNSNFDEVYSWMNKPCFIFDGMGMLGDSEISQLSTIGFSVFSIGY